MRRNASASYSITLLARSPLPSRRRSAPPPRSSKRRSRVRRDLRWSFCSSPRIGRREHHARTSTSTRRRTRSVRARRPCHSRIKHREHQDGRCDIRARAPVRFHGAMDRAAPRCLVTRWPRHPSWRFIGLALLRPTDLNAGFEAAKALQHCQEVKLHARATTPAVRFFHELSWCRAWRWRIESDGRRRSRRCGGCSPALR